MQFIPFDRVAKLEAIFLADSQRVENVHHFWFETAPTQDDLEELAASYKTWWTTELGPHLSSALSLQLVKVTDLTIEDGMSIEYATGLPVSGSAASPMLPNNVTIALKWTTGRAGRSYRGRTYILGLREDIVSANLIDTVYGGQLVTAYQNLVVRNLSVNDAVMVVASRFNNNLPRVTGLATVVTNCSLDRGIDSQRRRLPGRGR